MEVATAWVKPPPPAQGLDHLGTQQPCISYYTQLLPGITNVTDRARYYSLYPWLLWALDQRYPATDLAKYEAFFRRADCLLTLISERHANKCQEASERHGAAMAGRLTLVPVLRELEPNEKISLSRYATRDQVPERYFKNRFGGLGQYYLGPLQDLGMLDAGTGPWIKYTRQRGEVIARAVNDAVTADLFFRTLQDDAVSVRRLDELSSFCFCNLESSPKERQFLVDLFFDRNREHGPIGLQRRQSLALTLSLIDAVSRDANALVDVTFFRGAVYGKSLGRRKAWSIPPLLQPTADAWHLYERNDLLSNAMQAIFAVGLHFLEDSGRTFFSANEFGAWFAASSEVKNVAKAVRSSTFKAAMQKSTKESPGIGEWDDPKHEFQLCLRMLSEYGESADRSTLGSVLLKATAMLVALGQRTDPSHAAYGTSPFAAEFLADHPINLESFERNVAGIWCDMSIPELLGWLVSEWGISTHLGVALRKLRFNPQATFRVRPSERGLQVVEGIPIPAPTNPRVRQGLQVLRDIGAITYDIEGATTRLTPLGKSLLGEAIGS